MSYWHGQALKYSPSKHDWPAGAFGAVRPVVAILPTATAAGPFSRSRGRLRRSEGPCRHNMSYIFVISKVVFEGTKNLKIITKI